MLSVPLKLGLAVIFETWKSVLNIWSQNGKGLIFFFFSLDRVLLIAQADLELRILLPLSLEYWDYKCAPIITLQGN
jgi:hypothetical protein